MNAISRRGRSTGRAITTRLALVLMLSFTVLAGALASDSAKTVEAAAPSKNGPAATVDCGYVTCSLYLSRHITKMLASPVRNMAEIADNICDAIPSRLATVACGVIMKLTGKFEADQFKKAAAQNKCIRIRFIPAGQYGAVPVGLYVDNSKWCVN